MEHIDEGNNGRVYSSKSGVIKIQKRKSLGHDVMTQKKIHIILESLIEGLHLNILRVPKLNHTNTSQYEMEFVNTDNILYLGDISHSCDISDELYAKISEEFTLLWIALFSKGYAAWDIELFLQPTGKVMLLDFDKYGIVSNKGNTILMPHWNLNENQKNIKYFFVNSCFPKSFVSLLFGKGFSPPDCLLNL